MTTHDAHNQREIDRLNQRGGRMLSLVDLIEAGTVNPDLAAELAATAARGRSFLTAAGPGGVGKTTLMGAMLAFLPPEARLRTVESEATLAHLPEPEPGRLDCLVVHEIGAGHWFGYLWGPAVARYVVAAHTNGRMLASNLHAESYGEARDQLAGLGVGARDLAAVAALAFMVRPGGRRRVSEVWTADGRGGHRRVWQWDPDADAFERTAPAKDDPDAMVARCRAVLEAARADGVRRMESVRERFRAAAG